MARSDSLSRDVLAMEERLASLKAMMSTEKERRDQARKANPSGSVWRSARTDAPMQASYVNQVLKSAPPPSEQQPAPSLQGRQRGVVGDAARAARAAGIVPAPPERLLNTPPAAGTHAEGAATTFVQTKAFTWDPSAAIVGAETDSLYEDLLGPEVPLSAAPGPTLNGQSMSGDRVGVGGASAMATDSGSGGGSLLHGTFDEDESSASFAEALRAWRTGGEPAPAPAPAPRNRFALPPPQASQPPPQASQPSAGSSSAAAPPTTTLADKLHTLKRELGLPDELTLMDAVAQANAVVGLGAHGTLADQMDRILRETGIKPVAGCARPARPPSAQAGQGSSSTDTAAGSRPASARRPDTASSACGMQTQTQPASSFYERLLEQKRKDGLL